MVQGEKRKLAGELAGSESQFELPSKNANLSLSTDSDYSIFFDSPSFNCSGATSLPGANHACVHINTQVCRKVTDEVLRSFRLDNGSDSEARAVGYSEPASISPPCGEPATQQGGQRELGNMLPTTASNCASAVWERQKTLCNAPQIPDAVWSGEEATTVSLPDDCSSVDAPKPSAVFCTSSVHAQENTQHLYGGLGFEQGVTRRSRHSERIIEHSDRVEKFLYDLYQQQLPRSDMPFKMFRPKATFAFCGLWGLVLVSLGIALFVCFMDHREVVIEYSSDDGDMALIPFTVSKAMPTPVYLYYRIDGFYANFRAYVKDGPHQLSSYDCGAIKTQKEALTMRTIDGKLTLPQLKVSIESGKPIPEEAPEIFPCGAQSVAFFSDEFQIWKRESETKKSVQLGVDTDYIAYEWDFLQFMVKNSTWTSNGLSPWILMNDPRFRVWMHPPFTPQFQKLYGFLIEPLEPGLEYYAVIHRNGLLCWLVVLVLWLLKKFEIQLRSRTVIGVDLRKAAQRSGAKSDGSTVEQSRWQNEPLGLYGKKRNSAPRNLNSEAPVGEDEPDRDLSQGLQLAAKLPATPSCVCPAHSHVPDPGRSSRALLDPSGPTGERDSRHSPGNAQHHQESERFEDEALSEDDSASSSREVTGAWGERASESEESGDSYRARKAAYVEECRNT